MDKENGLLSTFLKPTAKDWLKVASSEINDANPMDALKWFAEDDLSFKPYHTSDDQNALGYLQHFQFTRNEWQNMPVVIGADETIANKQALDHLHHEAEGVVFDEVNQNTNFDVLLEGISLPHCAVSFFSDPSFPLTALENYYGQHAIDKRTLTGAIFWSAFPSECITLEDTDGFKKLGILISSSSPTVEISNGLYKAVQCIEQYRKQGYDLNLIIRQLAFSFSIGPKLLVEVSKLKAFRTVWYQITQAYGITEYNPDDLYLHGRSEVWKEEKFEPHGNLLKSTIATVAGVSGGCNAVSVMADEENGTMTSRIARNISSILKYESHFNKASDPFAGSYSIEVMVDSLAREAWKKFQSKL